MVFLGVLIHTNTRQGGVQVNSLGAETCLNDKTFDTTITLNKFFLDNIIARDWVIIFNSGCFDITIMFLMFLYKVDKLPSLSFAVALIISAGLKSIMQQYLFTF